MDKRGWQNAVGIAVAVLFVIGFGLSRVIGGAGTGDGPAATCDDPVTWQQAGDLDGRATAIVGPVVRVSHEPEVGGGPTFLNLGNPHPDPDRFDVVIYEDVRDRFDRPPEDLFDGREICVLGRVRDRDGVPQIILDNPGWISTR